MLYEKKLKMLHALYADRSHSVADISATLNISRSTLYRYVKADKQQTSAAKRGFEKHRQASLLRPCRHGCWVRALA